MKKTTNRFRLPLQKLPLLADWRIKRRLAQAAKVRRMEEDGVTGWGSFFAPKYAMATVAFALVIAVGGYQWLPGYVYNADSIVRGDTLYDWKRTQEKTALAKLDNAPARAEFYLGLSDKRLREAKNLVDRQNGKSWLISTASAAVQKPVVKVPQIQVSPKDSLVAGLITESGLFLQKSITETGKIKEVATADALLKKINTQLEQQKQTLSQINQDSNDPVVEATAPVILTHFDAHEKLISKANNLLQRPEFHDHFESKGFEFHPLEIEILEDEISDANRAIFTLYAEIEALENEYEALEEVLETVDDPRLEDQIEAELEALDEEIEVLDEVAEEVEEELEETFESLEDWEDEADDHDDFDADEWSDDWYDDHWDEEWDDEFAPREIGGPYELSPEEFEDLERDYEDEEYPVDEFEEDPWEEDVDIYDEEEDFEPEEDWQDESEWDEDEEWDDEEY